MVWGAFAWGGKSPLKFITGNVNSEVYQNIITENLLTVADEIAGLGWIFQQDNTSCHVSASSTTEEFQSLVNSMPRRVFEVI